MSSGIDLDGRIDNLDDLVKSRHSGGNGSAELAEDRSPGNL
jgi:hypothetical protein